MPIAYEVTPELRVKFKEPFGQLIRGSFFETMSKMKKMIREEKPTMVISVGDIVSRNLHENKMNPQLSITDNRKMRKRIKPRVLAGKNIVYVKNPQGTITKEAIKAIKEALSKNDEQIQIIVDGEEDLLTIVAVLLAPENSLVVYGQPYMGVVVVRATPEKKTEAKKILNAMKTVRKAK
jgi:hypothetical protein